MHTRHRIPTVFSIYMMDVLCCALGCVVLLWQVSYQDAEEKTQEAINETAAASTSLQRLDQANQTIVRANQRIVTLSGALDQANQTIVRNDQTIVTLTGELQSIKATLADSHKKYLQLNVELDKTKLERDKTKLERDLAIELALARKQEYDQLKKTHAATEALLASLKLDKKELQSKNTLTAAQLADKLKAHVDLLDKIARAEARVVLLEKDVDAKKLELLLASNKNEAQTAKLKDADGRVVKLEKQLVDLRGIGQDAISRLKIADLRIKLLEQESDRGKTDVSDNKRRLQMMMTEQDVLSKRLLISAKDLADARAMISSLEGEKLSLINRTRNIQAAMENRFAGITLTGKQVVFLVDMSGSMDMIDENTLDPDKWPLVCETVGRLMQSLTDLRHFQVILFSDRNFYPLRNPGRWLEYGGPQTAKDTVAVLKAVKPKGGTDMYAALAEAFRFRGQGLDTIYLLSDGLPNVGEGTPANADKLNEQQLTDILAKHVRQKLKRDWNRYIAGQPKVRINSVGFFFESPDVGAFLWALSREHDGSFVGMSK